MNFTKFFSINSIYSFLQRVITGGGAATRGGSGGAATLLALALKVYFLILTRAHLQVLNILVELQIVGIVGRQSAGPKKASGRRFLSENFHAEASIHSRSFLPAALLQCIAGPCWAQQLRPFTPLHLHLLASVPPRVLVPAASRGATRVQWNWTLTDERCGPDSNVIRADSSSSATLFCAAVKVGSTLHPIERRAGD